MTTTQDVLRVGQAAQAMALTGENIKLMKKKKKKAGDFIKVGATNIVGISLLRSQGNIISSLH